MKNKYIIKDWANNRLFPTKFFNTFEDAWEYATEHIDNELYYKTEDENDNVMQDIVIVLARG